MATATQSTRNGLNLCHEGYMYFKKVTRPDKIWWKCVKNTSDQCRGAISTDLNHGNIQPGGIPHNHLPCVEKVEVVKVRVAMKRRAGATRENPGQIYQDELIDLPAGARPYMPQPDVVKRTLCNQRPALRDPAGLDQLGPLPDNLRTTVGGEPFLIYDNGANNRNRVLVFSSPQCLEKLGNVDTVYMDGNFAMAPAIFSQVYCVCIPFGQDNFITAAYALLPNKRRVTYEEFLTSIVDACQGVNVVFSPLRTMTDFEDGMMRAVRAILGANTISQGCFYHLTQSTWRKIQEFGLAAQYRQDDDLQLFCSQMDGLAFLPIIDVPAGMVHLRAICPPAAQPLIDYFDRTYVSGGNGVQPIFPPHTWNVHQQTLDYNPRTNNVVEGWNNKMRVAMNYHHPTTSKVVEWFRKEAVEVDTVIAQDAIGNVRRKRVKQEYVEMQRRLVSLIGDLQAGRKDIPQFLRGVGFNIKLTRRLDN